jgi:hypothetical protein
MPISPSNDLPTIDGSPVAVAAGTDAAASGSGAIQLAHKKDARINTSKGGGGKRNRRLKVVGAMLCSMPSSLLEQMRCDALWLRRRIRPGCSKYASLFDRLLGRCYNFSL